jgi:hypothetical protein
MHCSKGEVYAIFEVGVKALYHRGKFRHCAKEEIQTLYQGGSSGTISRGRFMHCENDLGGIVCI